MARYRVSVSARVIRWPQFCVCCGREADTDVDASSTRVHGSRVVRTHTKSWPVPYCYRCLDHQEAWYASRPPGWPIAMALWVAIPALGFAVCAGVAEILLLAACFAVVALAALAVGIWLRGTIARTKRENVRESMLDGCACAGPAVEYEGWSGSIHTFAFASPDYATRFERANANKVIG